MQAAAAWHVSTMPAGVRCYLHIAGSCVVSTALCPEQAQAGRNTEVDLT